VARIFAIIWLTLATLVVVFSYAVQQRWTENMILARQHYIDLSHKDTTRGVENIGNKFKSIYENLRTLSYLPGVRGIDRHGTNFSEEARVTFQQIYNNLAVNLAVSEIYIVPVDLAPERFDPITLKNEEPIMMFDELILNAGNGMSNFERLLKPQEVAKQKASGPKEVEEFEYRQLVEQMIWLKANYGSVEKIKGFDVPFISGNEIITCDNSQFIKSFKDKDRSGIIFSVPFYGADGKLKGTVSAILLSNRLNALVQSNNLALVNVNNGYVNENPGDIGLKSSGKFVAEGNADPSLIYSEVVPLGVIDNRSPWSVWAGLPDKSFNESEVVKSATKSRRQEFLTLAGIALAAAISIYLMQVNFAQARRLNQVMKNERDLSAKAEAEATLSSETFQSLNNDIWRLNNDLAEKIKLLTQAQEDIVEKGKMAQLGNLVATVAHELRNPLGGVRTTTFLLRRKLKDSPIDVAAQLDRIEVGVSRCDNIISQLLDFSRTQPLSTEAKDLNVWLQDLLVEESAKLHEEITVRYVLSAPEMSAEIDSERLRRGVINLLTNAADAMVSKTGTNLVGAEHSPEIMVELQRSARGVEIAVRDNGPGIPADLMSKISEPLFTTKSFGTGLGLAAVRKVAELHGGGLEISSVPGMGASFTIWFPTKVSSTIAA
jgi:signal transduction histidine kinase